MPSISNEKNQDGGSNMIGKKIKVFWPVDEKWYTGVVQEFNATTGEHKLRYPDGDEEWVKIGENNNGNVENGEGVTAASAVAGSSGLHQQHKQPSPSSGQTPSGAMGILGAAAAVSGSNQSSPEGRSSDRANEFTFNGSPTKQHPHMYNEMMNGMNPANFINPYQPPHFGAMPHPYGPGGFGGVGGPPGAPGFHPHFDMRAAGAVGAMQYSLPHHALGPHRMGGISPSRLRNRDPDLISSKDGSPSHIKNTPDSSDRTGKKKSGPKTWSKEEDSQLLSMVQKMRMPIKWSLVSQSMPDRTGKQCRERYVNHLNPRLKSCDWSPAEDATIFHLYNTCGSQWAKMSKMIPGRTDNGIKNRFHNLRRQLEREDEHRIRLSKPEDFPDEVKLDKIREFPEHLRGKCDKLWDMTDGVGVLAAQSVLGGSFARNAGRFGPFRKADANGEQCARCGLYAPSTQCGTQICTKTGWCIACTRLPPHMCSNILRECLNLRRIEEDAQDGQENKLIKAGALNLALADAAK